MTEQQQQTKQTNQQAIQAVSAFLYELFKADPEIELTPAFYKAKERFNGMPGMKKEHFEEIFNASKAQFAKPLVKANLDLAEREADLRLRVSNALHDVEPTGPDQTRELIGIVRAIRQSDPGPAIEFAMGRALHRLPSDLAEEVQACWPSLKEGSDVE